MLCFRLSSECSAGKGEGEGDGEAVLPRSAFLVELLQLTLPKLEDVGDAVLVLGARGDEAYGQRVAIEEVKESGEISILLEVGRDAEDLYASTFGTHRLRKMIGPTLTRGRALLRARARAQG